MNFIKHCSICNEIKPLFDFRHRKSYWCWDCYKQYIRKKKKEYRIIKNEWSKKECERITEYNKSPKMIEYHRMYSKEYRIKNKNKIKAQNILNSKKINCDIKCKICNSNKNLIKHHPDYSKPLLFITLCKSCHQIIHRSNPMEYIIINN